MNTPVRNPVRRLWAALRALLVLTLVCGVLYPLAVTGAAQALMPGRANGSEVTAEGRSVGSSLIGQRYDLPGGAPDLKWFQPRPSEGLGTNSRNTRYALLVSGASNLSGDNAELIHRVTAAKAAVVRDNSVPGHPVDPSRVPADAVTSSGSGLDPDISPEYARLQVRRVAARNHLDAGRVARLVERHTDGRLLGFIGEPRVNVLELNTALRQLVTGTN
ncbi:K+-transporting ATPase ATPase C chain [Streptomyces sp. KhCrAH-43]|uniref:K(+)-transporting ATPase subunit C n=1 Tax=unclassified Streptomyces TaxID=2593676 RepID=UPI0003661168|nr:MULTISPECIES: K(+)-transporting ATPase subunit C [unclassified Streptomyces]MYS34400.1 K(+)-transporting ATPase subunit C [Streptomyces sp. SID4920]MYX64561.1 K(+)-transporting ATPase subunit C [Streptomyces sp. SID8373]RAJ51091.1 K+-transporting ATPase ATPase C chain [Streptomyces sp. KhCrAH-43]